VGHKWAEWYQYLSYNDVENLGKYFRRSWHAEYHFLTPVFRVIPIPRTWLRALIKAESALMRALPFLRRFAWITCFVGEF